MDLLKLKLPMALVIGALGVASGSGGALAIAGAKQAQTAAIVEQHQVAIDALRTESQQNRERVLRIEILSESTAKAVERIERKLDRRPE